MRGYASSYGPILVIIAVLALVPLAAQMLDNPFIVRVSTRAVVFAIAAVALNLVLGFGGLVSLMHAGLFGLGAYTVGILSYHEFNGDLFLGSIAGSANLALLLPLAVVLVGLASAAMGMVSLRTRGSYFIMITLAFNQMLYFFFVALQEYGGEDGLQILSDLHFLGFDITARVPFYFVCLGTLAAALLLLTFIVESRFGMVLRGTAQNERRVIALGIPSLPYKLAAFVISGMITGLAGALWASGQQFVSPSDMSWIRSGDFVVIAVLGGLSRVWGPVIGAIVYATLEALLPTWTMYWQLPFGLLIILTAATLRGGLIDLGDGLACRLGARHDD